MKTNISVKIGYTFISNQYWGTDMNYHIKKLMLEYIFKFLDKVYLDIWKINYRSQKSIEKLGGKKITLNNDKYLYLLEKKVWENIKDNPEILKFL